MSMKKRRPPSPGQRERQYARWRRELSQVGYISRGSVQDRTNRPGGGAGYQWTRKVAGKTVTVALTAEQFQKMKEAVNNQRKLAKILRQMEAASRRILFQTHPHGARRKRLSDKVLGLI
jgi:hypothetical protein